MFFRLGAWNVHYYYIVGGLEKSPKFFLTAFQEKQKSWLFCGVQASYAKEYLEALLH